MAELYLDVHLELDPFVLAGVIDPTQTVAELARHEAEERCLVAGATLRHPEPSDVVVRQALKPLTGEAVLLVATRWVADGPERRGAGGGGAG